MQNVQSGGGARTGVENRCNTVYIQNTNIMANAFILKPGLIIDAFGELRDQQEQVKEDMEVSACPPCKV